MSLVDQMFQKGLVREAKKNYAQRLSQTARQAIGYKELYDFFEGKSSLEEARELIKKNTRHLAKRQITWFKREEGICWVEPSYFRERKLL